MSAPRVLELFAGCGGASLGLRSAGLRHVACVERDAAAASTLATAGLPVLHADVRDVDYTVFSDVDAVWASPPCQPGSTAGKRRGSADVRDGWPWTLDALDVVQPRWFMAENVLGWTFHAQGCPVRQRPTPGCVGCSWEHVVVPEIRRRFAFVSTWRLNAADYGVPQHRRRVIVVAGPVPTTPPPPTHGDPSDEDTEVEVCALGSRSPSPSGRRCSTPRPATSGPATPATPATARTAAPAPSGGASTSPRRPSPPPR